MKLMTRAKDGQLVLDFDDVVQRSMTVVRDGELTWPPPPVQVSAAPAAAATASAAAQGPAASPVKKPVTARRRFTLAGLTAAVFFVPAALSPAPLPPHPPRLSLALST